MTNPRTNPYGFPSAIPILDDKDFEKTKKLFLKKFHYGNPGKKKEVKDATK
jgi:hypothetical protein